MVQNYENERTNRLSFSATPTTKLNMLCSVPSLHLFGFLCFRLQLRDHSQVKEREIWA